MACCCGHGPWHYHGYPHYPMAYAAGPYAQAPSGYPPVEGYGRRRRRRRRERAEELAEYLHELEEEIADLRRELDELGTADAAET